MFKRMVQAVDTHSGEPMRVITGGVGHIPGDSVFEKMQWLKKNDDALRLLMLREPRGYPPVCCNIIVPPCNSDADAGFIVMEQIEYPAMSGGNVISVATVLLETGMIPMVEPLTEFVLEAPAGLIAITAKCKSGKATEITFKNVPAFAVLLDKIIDVPELGKVKVDVSWGGMFYVITDANQFGLELIPKNGGEIAKHLALILAAAREQVPVRHPTNKAFDGISIAQLSAPCHDSDADMVNSVLVATGDIDLNNPNTWTGSLDRCPCGTGTCAKMAALYAKGELKLNQDFRHKGTLGTVYTGRLIDEIQVGSYKAVIPTISGQSWITSFSTYVLHPTDPFPEGYTMGDIWPE